MIVHTKTLKLIKSISSGKAFDDDIDDLIKLAKLNKVLLGFLRKIGYGGFLRIKEERLYKHYIAKVSEVSRILSDLDYALYKFRKPIEHVSTDIDIIIRQEHLPSAVKRLTEKGFKVKLLEPYTITMVRDKTIVDLYTNPSFAWIVYLDGKRLLEEIEIIEIGDVEAKALNIDAEVVVAAAHAVYKEHIYLLADYYITKKWLSGKAMKLARELNAEDAIRMSMKLNEQIEQGRIEVPAKLKPIEITRVLTNKFIVDSIFRATTTNIARLIAKERGIQLLSWRIRRKSY